VKLHRRVARHAVNGGLRLFAVMLALLALAVPAYAYYESTRPPGVQLGEQVEVPLPENPETLPGGMPSYDDGVIVLCYHDLSRKAEDPYAVTPRAFADQMAALKASGFETVSLDEFNAYMAGEGELPERAVLVTFDDGTKSNWVFADPVLRELGFEATDFLITADVSHHQPYYLLWEEVEAMQESGRWSFGSHTDDGHGFLATNKKGEEGPFLTNRAWLAQQQRLETRAEYEARISADLDRSIARMQAHGLPRPSAFAYPFSAVETSNDPVVASLLDQMLDERFADVLVNRTEDTFIQRGHANPLSRVEVFNGTTTQALLKQLRHTIEYGETGRHTADD
jgi:poly-beta-1,6-N-acetyl-D-glucosamine N-deacetylase